METKPTKSTYDVVIIGGAGHVGLPLGLVFADHGYKTCLYDIDQDKLTQIAKGHMPFMEHDAEPILKRVLNRTLFTSSEKSVVSEAAFVVICLGTPVDGYLNPSTSVFLRQLEVFKPYLHTEQTIIVRSTIYPRTCQQLLRMLGEKKGPWHLAYCPERTAQGTVIRELKELPQIVSGVTEKAAENAAKLFAPVVKKIIRLELKEAELVKLFTNAWRYIQFSVANQFYMMAHEFGVDFTRVRSAMVEGYGRAADLPKAGFAAGPCLLKDTMQLAAFGSNRFVLGQAAMMVNEGLPNFIVDHLQRRHRLSQSKVGILGMTFKADIDDIRDSLSYKLGKILRFHGAQVFYSDEYAKDPTFVSKEALLKAAQIIIVGVPHQAYQGLTIPSAVEVVDLWGVTTGGKRLQHIYDE